MYLITPFGYFATYTRDCVLYIAGVQWKSFWEFDGKPMETKGKRIRNCMRQKAITQQQLANALGVYPSAVAKWLADENQPSDEYIVAMAKIFGVEPEYIWSGRNPITDDVDEVAQKYANLSERDKGVVDSVIASLKPEQKNGNGNGQ